MTTLDTATSPAPENAPGSKPWVGIWLLAGGFVLAQVVTAIVSIPMLLVDNPGVLSSLKDSLHAGEDMASALNNAIPNDPKIGAATTLCGLIIPWLFMLLFARMWAQHALTRTGIVRTAIVDSLVEPRTRVERSVWLERLGLVRLTKSHVKQGVLLGLVAAILLDGVVSALLHVLGITPEGESTNTDLILNVTGVAGVIVLIGGALGAPIVEEIFFRGALTSAVARRASARVACLVSAVLFGLVHLTGISAYAIATVVIVGALGYVFAAIRLKTGTIMITIVAHITFNTVGLALAKIFGVS